MLLLFFLQLNYKSRIWEIIDELHNITSGVDIFSLLSLFGQTENE